VILEVALKAKFHYASWLQLASVMEFGFYLAHSENRTYCNESKTPSLDIDVHFNDLNRTFEKKRRYRKAQAYRRKQVVKVI